MQHDESVCLQYAPFVLCVCVKEDVIGGAPTTCRRVFSWHLLHAAIMKTLKAARGFAAIKKLNNPLEFIDNDLFNFQLIVRARN